MPTITLKSLLTSIVSIDDSDDFIIQGLTSDSRHIKSGDVFLAYPGLHVDGRNYIQKAIQQGAAAIIYEANDADVQNKTTTIPFIAVPNLQHCMGDLAARFYEDPSASMTTIGVTGTNGKTSCVQFLAQALERHGQHCGVMGTLGNGFLMDLQKTAHTTPDPIQLQKDLASLRDQAAQAVAMEVSSHALDQGRIQGVQLDIAVLTQLSRDHLDYHGDMQSYANAKELLFRQPGLRYGVVNVDDAFGRHIAKNYAKQLKLFGYSIAGDQDGAAVPVLSAKKITILPQGFRVEVESPWGTGVFETALLGRFNISNLLAVLTVLCVMDIPFSEALHDLSQLTTVRGRLQRFGQPHQPQVIVDYAHTPDALQKALSALREHCHGQIVCVFGCGGDRDQGKRPQMAAMAERYADNMIMTSDNPRTESPQQIINDMQAGLSSPNTANIELDRAKAIQKAVQRAGVDDIVLIAGKGHETVQIIGKEAFPFDDAEVVKQALMLWDQGLS